uniref:Ig-like domain-containing protein n=1 Tax=Leptobrachium leishanense TaxID=445787 RepID=A0A8C5Q5E7_9ANUR
MCLSQVSLSDMCLSRVSLSDVCLSVSDHSLQYYHTGVSVPGHGLPLFSSVGYVDGIEIVRYRSDVGRVVPVAPWMQKVEDPDYWERNTQIGKSNEAAYKKGVKTLMNRYNQTGGFHSYQNMFGCELRDDGSSRGYMQYGYDGKDFLALDPERGVYYPLTDQAQVTAQRWNSPEERWGERYKNYLETDCIDWLKIHLKNGQEELERRVRPEVKVSDQTVNGVTKLHCQVYGFYPRDVDVKWQKNGIDVPSHEAKHVLPNSDGTYQIRVAVEVAAEDREGHSCNVDHASLDQQLTVKWEPQSSSNTLWIVIGFVLGGVLVIAGAAAGFIIWWKRSISGKKTNHAHTSGISAEEVTSLYGKLRSASDKDGSSTSSND